MTKHWTETIVKMLYFKSDVPMILEKLENSNMAIQLPEEFNKKGIELRRILERM